MGKTSKIQWCDATWNVARGCTKVDQDCKFCYMYRESYNNSRFNPLQVVKTKGVFNMPLKLKEPSKIFTSSLTDFFHPAIDSYRNEAWDIIRRCPHHIFQILTKRPERITANLPDFWEEIRNHVWLGTSIGAQSSIRRVEDLINTDIDKTILFLSLEPLYGEITLSETQLKKINWVITGGESGNESGKYRYRPCELTWIEKIVTSCQGASVPVFVKQLGTYLAKTLKMNDRHGGDIDEFPEHLKIREFPNLL